MNSSVKLLLIEDNRGDYILLDEYLQDSKLNYSLDWAQSLAEGTEKLTSGAYDVVLLDLGLPDSVGMETLERAREIEGDHTIIVLTGNTDEEQAISAVQAGAQDYIIKGEISPFFLHRVIKYGIDRKRTDKILRDYNATLEDEINVRTAELQALKESLEEKVKLRTAELQEANAVKDKFFSIIAHDLISPFSSLNGFLKLLVERYEEDSDLKRKNQLLMLRDNAQNTLNLLMNLLEWSRSQRDKLEFNPKQVQVKEIIAEVCKGLSTSLQSKEITIVSEIEEQHFVFADSNMLKTVFHNLLVNAIKFSFPKSEIMISGRQQDKDVYISIRDSGIGMEAEQKDKLFKPGENVQQKGTANEKGTGLGLILVDELIQKNNGRILVDSKLGQGSKFTVVLPCRELI